MTDTMTLKEFFERFLELSDERGDEVIREIRDMASVDPDPDFEEMGVDEIAQLCLLEVQEAYLDTLDMEFA